jgi:hypothetical protein
VKTVFIFSFVALPLLLIALVTSRFGFTVFSTLAASVVGELLVFLLFASYNKWKAAEILSGKTSGVVAYAGTPDLRARGMALLLLCALGIAIGLLAVSVHWMYSRAQSA